MKILMVCSRNIRRSPLAEGILESKARKLGLPWEVDSAGTNNNYHIGEAPIPYLKKWPDSTRWISATSAPGLS